MRRAPLLVAMVAIGGLGALTAPGTTSVTAESDREDAAPQGSYGWPVKPFFRQHPVRGNLGDPRIGPGRDGTMHYTLHLGVDIVAPNFTPVYATVSGTVSIHPLHADTVMVADGTGRVLEYWHVIPTMRQGHATAYATVIGHVEPPWAHVNLSERLGSAYVNPLRAGALWPYDDDVPPSIGEIRFEADGREVSPTLYGPVDVVVGAYDPPTRPVPPPWDDIRLTPALVRWRIVSPTGDPETAWQVVFDVRHWLPQTPFFDVYAAGTWQNRDHGPGWYRFYLAHGWSASHLGRGIHAVEVSAADIRDNRATERLAFVVVDA